ncbi:MAG: ADP-forming succinate--CoA ligase subunit beta [Firmicutes bacterium]|nr:ADP-forming succinate--CoA ligase subunit beta [Bacillota bacterium]
MKLYEYLAKDVFARNGLPVPKGRVARTPEEAEAIAREIGEVAIKSQVLAGARGKAGGIAFAATPVEAREAAARLLGTEIRGFRVEQVLVEEKLKIERELYLGITVDKAAKEPLVIASNQGGMNIEGVPERQIIKRRIDIRLGLYPYVGREVARRLELAGEIARQVADTLTRLYRVFRNYDAELVEINPLVISGERVIAADARLNVDDDALYRHRDLPLVEEGTELEKKIKALGLAYVELEGDIAVMANGAGITMATLDVLQRYGGRPANFLDAGGGAGVEPTAQAIEVLLMKKPKAMLINIFGGITRCDDVARAVVQVKTMRGIPVPLVIRLVGTNEVEGLEILRENGLAAYRSMDEAARAVVAAARGEAQALGNRN